MTRKEFLEAVKKTFNLDFDVTEDMDLELVTEDSIAVMGIVSLYNKNAAAKITMDDFWDFTTVKDMLDKGGFK